MKSLIFLVTLMAAYSGTALAHGNHDSEESNPARIILPEEEDDYFGRNWRTFNLFQIYQYRFNQTTWGECSEAITGNFSGYKCSDKRAISVILKKFLADHVYTCINRGLAAQGGGRVAELHIEHNGITGDARHSPRSLHAENRAIDVKAFDMKLADGKVKKFVYAGTANRPFYVAFRNCWGDVIKNYNGCPYASGVRMHTGSIGWEDKNHKQHLHLSVPYCVGGSYSRSFYQR